MTRWSLEPRKRRLGFELALSGHHFIRYARIVADALETESRQAVTSMHPGFVPQPEGQSRNLVQIKESGLHHLT
jgi:hypothetical protein